MAMILDMTKDGVVASVPGHADTPVRSMEDYAAVVQWADEVGMPIFVSSSMDFPHEYTTDPDALELARRLRNLS